MVNRFLLVGYKCIPEIHLRFTYGACRSITKIQKNKRFTIYLSK